MKLAVIILNWNRSRETFQSASDILAWNRLSPTLWIVDNASKEKAQLPATKYVKNLQCIRSKMNMGFAGGNNLAIKDILLQDYDAVLLLNNDAHISEENVEKLIDTLTSTPRLGILGPILYEQNNKNILLSLGGKDISKYTHSRRLIQERDLEQYTSSNELLSVDYVPGTVALIRMEAFKKVGLLDENYFFSGEIADFCERAKKQGYLCAIDLKSTGTHETNPESPMRNTLYLYYSLRNRFLFIKKFRKQKRLYLYPLWILIGLAMILKAFILGQFKKARAAGLALTHGLYGKFGNQNALFIN